MFQFDYSFAQLLSTPWPAPKALTITHCSFTHFLHNFQSIIELPYFGAVIEVSNSEFSKISSCGAIMNSLDFVPVFAQGQ